MGVRSKNKNGGQVYTLDRSHLVMIKIFMARPLRIEYPEAFYHITSRGKVRSSGVRSTHYTNLIDQ
jgi:hypothetical protein